MAFVYHFVVTFVLIASVFSKQWHIKDDLEAKDKQTRGFMNIFNNEEMPPVNERFARHMREAVTESALEHLITELKQQYYSENYNPNSPINRLIRNLSKEMKRHEHSKMLKERQMRKQSKKNNRKSNTKKATRRKIIQLGNYSAE